MNRVMYTRYVDGQKKVEWDTEQSIFRVGGAEFHTKSSLMQFLTGKKYGFDSYFKSSLVSLSVLDLWPSVLGIDLNRYWKDVRKIFYKGFSRKVLRAGYNPEEVLQEIYIGILKRNQGKCPWDPEKSSLGHYVWMVCQCIIANYFRKGSKSQNEVIGVMSYDKDGEYGNIDVSDTDMFKVQETQEDRLLEQDLIDHVLRSGKSSSEVAAKMVPLLKRGMNQTEIANELSLPLSQIHKANKVLRQQAKFW